MLMKRKEFEDINHDFSFISLSSSSRKSRRLDGELFSIMEEDPRIEQGLTSTSVSMEEERAVVLYNPANTTPFLKSPTSPDFSIIINSHLIPGLKDHFFLSSSSLSLKNVEDESAKDTSTESDDCLAVVPWVAPRFPLASGIEGAATGLSDPMESDEVEAEMMDMEDTDNGSSARDAFELGGMMEGAEGLPQWLQQQQYYMAPQMPQNTSTPITW